ncbi:hypothetical protein BDW66DRAFT_138100 [Aspergillus desertorum]
MAPRSLLRLISYQRQGMVNSLPPCLISLWIVILWIWFQPSSDGKTFSLVDPFTRVSYRRCDTQRSHISLFECRLTLCNSTSGH